MNTNRVSATVPTTDLEAVLTDIQDICQKLPFLIDLTTSERVALPKMGDRNEAFVYKALEVAEQHPEMFPSGFLDEMRKDAKLLDSLTPIRRAIETLCKRLDDTSLQVGAEAFAAARTVYAVTKTPFADAKLRTAASDLSKRFRRKTASGTTSGPAVPPGPATPTPDV